MQTVTRKPELESEDNPYVIVYKCICGYPIEYQADNKPERLIKCWKCS